jgi:hypothetical protein
LEGPPVDRSPGIAGTSGDSREALPARFLLAQPRDINEGFRSRKQSRHNRMTSPSVLSCSSHSFEAHGGAVVFLAYLGDFPDPRQPGKVIYQHLSHLSRTTSPDYPACALPLAVRNLLAVSIRDRGYEP